MGMLGVVCSTCRLVVTEEAQNTHSTVDVIQWTAQKGTAGLLLSKPVCIYCILCCIGRQQCNLIVGRNGIINTQIINI